MATSKALAELLAKKGNIEEARMVLQAALDRLEANRSKHGIGGGRSGLSAEEPGGGTAGGGRKVWVGPGRRARPTAGERDEETEGTAELLLAWANMEDGVRVGVERGCVWVQISVEVFVCLYMCVRALVLSREFYFAWPSESMVRVWFASLAFRVGRG